MSSLWSRVSKELRRMVVSKGHRGLFDEGQRRSLAFISDMLPRHGVVVADEVGTGKTRIACALIDAVTRCGGRAVVVVPRGLLGQWRDEFRLLRPSAEPRTLTTWLEFLEEGVGKRTKGEWWLVSHGFRFPSLHAGSTRQSPAWKFALPWLVLLAAEKDKRYDGRTRLNRLWEQVDLERMRWKGQWALAAEMAKRLPKDLHSALIDFQLPDWEGGDNGELTELFTRGGDRGPGLKIVDHLLRRWIGPVDLVVVDEAHKSRDYDTEGPPRTTLSELLAYILDTNSESRRLCLTATPMELSVDQWGPLLHRARAKADTAKLEVALVGLKDAVRSAADVPDEEHRIRELEEAARRFEKTLRPFVTRRRRAEEALLRDFKRRIAGHDIPHPHRHIQQVVIRWDTDVMAAGPEWRRLLIALEGIARSAKGLSNDQLIGSVKTLHTKLASGHVSLDLLDEGRLATPFPNEPTPQQLRFLYWCKQYDVARAQQQRAAKALNLSGFDPDAEHPRILAAVREIETWATEDGGRVPEKVLCFGVYLRPLRLLRDVLNVRHALRCVDRDEPVLASIESLRAVAYRNYERMLAEGRFSNRLKGGHLSTNALMKRLAEGHKKYQLERERIGRRVDRSLDQELARIGVRLETGPLSQLREALHTIALEAKRNGEDEGEWRDVLSRVIEGKEEGPQSGRAADVDDDPEIRLRKWIEAEHGQDADGRVRSGFCRLLQGTSEWVTRRTLQASFNRPDRFPRVLLAQSAVGREGLNLHKACRVVVQLHAEWNPAILEQQIGRVDRKGSLWASLAEKWIASGGATNGAPRIEVRQLVFSGTYDAKQWERVGRRQHLFDAALFGNLLPLDSWLRASDEHRRRLAAAAPNFSPPPLSNARRGLR